MHLIWLLAACWLFACSAGGAVENRVTPGMICCDTYSLRDLFGNGTLTLETVPALMEELGIPGVAFNDFFFQSWERDYLDKVKVAMAKHKRVPVALIMEGNLATPDDAAWERQIEDNLKKLRAAAYLGCPVVRMNVGGTGDAERDATYGVERVAAAFRRMLPAAKELGVRITIENHGGVSASADNILRIIELTDREWVGSCLDFGNWPAEVRYESCRKLAPYAYHTHAKSYSFDQEGEETRMEFGRILAYLRAAGYKGALSVEFEGGGDQVEGVKRTRDLLVRYWPAGANTLADVWQRILPKGAGAEKVAGGFQFTEGPAWDSRGTRCVAFIMTGRTHKARMPSSAGHLYFSDIPADSIYRLERNGKVSLFLHPSGKANGLAVDSEGNVVACRHGRDVVRITPCGEITTIADSYDWKLFNSPNDLAIARDGSIYFSDPIYGLEGRAPEQPVEGVYRVGSDGKVTRIISDMVRPNGIVIGPGEKTLYVADSERKVIRAYDLGKDGSVSNGRDFAAVEGAPDGMAMDSMGNIYCAAAGVWVFDPAGNKLGVIPIPEKPSNCAFGGPQFNVLFVTARTSLYRLALGVEGWRGQ